MELKLLKQTEWNNNLIRMNNNIHKKQPKAILLAVLKRERKKKEGSIVRL